jgi:prolyl-tRNA editing enzyme YbaK/EbsC (Cys-tRNA(Pro) deacylase)
VPGSPTPSTCTTTSSTAGTGESARQLGVDEHTVVKTLVMQDEQARPLIVLMHGDHQVGLKAPGARDRLQEGRTLCARGGAAPQRLPGRRHLALRHPQGDAGVRGGSILELPKMHINGGRRGYLVGLEPRAALALLAAQPVRCAA